MSCADSAHGSDRGALDLLTTGLHPAAGIAAWMVIHYPTRCIGAKVPITIVGCSCWSQSCLEQLHELLTVAMNFVLSYNCSPEIDN